MINIKNKKIIIICGHYGTGKTNIAVNLAVGLKQKYNENFTLVDLDIVNPYFRSADNKKDLNKIGLDCIIPEFANTNVDIPSVPSNIYSIFLPDKKSIIDVGGDDTGAIVLGMFSEQIGECDYEMIYVINKYRGMLRTTEEALKMAADIERNSKLKITSIVNNSHVGEFTEPEYVINSIKYANEISEKLKLPLLYSSVEEKIYNIFSEDEINRLNLYKIKNYTKKIYI